MTDVYNKHNVIHIKGCRYYLVDLKIKEYNFENTIPYCCIVDGVEIYDSSWKGMIVKLCEYLDDVSPKPIEELLNISNFWGKQAVFSLVKKTNYTPFKGIYINTNHTAVHAMWTIQLLLDKYNIDLDNCKFVIKRLPIAEPKEVRDYERDRTITSLREYLVGKNKTEDFVNRIIKNVEIINNKIMPKLSVGYYDLFLIEVPAYFSNYASKVLEYAKTKLMYNEGQLKTIEYTLNYLGKIIKKQYKDDKVNLESGLTKPAFDDLDDFPEDF